VRYHPDHNDKQLLWCSSGESAKLYLLDNHSEDRTVVLFRDGIACMVHRTQRSNVRALAEVAIVTTLGCAPSDTALSIETADRVYHFAPILCTVYYPDVKITRLRDSGIW